MTQTRKEENVKKNTRWEKIGAFFGLIVLIGVTAAIVIPTVRYFQYEKYISDQKEIMHMLPGIRKTLQKDMGNRTYNYDSLHEFAIETETYEDPLPVSGLLDTYRLSLDYKLDYLRDTDGNYDREKGEKPFLLAEFEPYTINPETGKRDYSRDGFFVLFQITGPDILEVYTITPGKYDKFSYTITPRKDDKFSEREIFENIPELLKRVKTQLDIYVVVVNDERYRKAFEVTELIQDVGIKLSTCLGDEKLKYGVKYWFRAPARDSGWVKLEFHSSLNGLSFSDREISYEFGFGGLFGRQFPYVSDDSEERSILSLEDMNHVISGLQDVGDHLNKIIEATHAIEIRRIQQKLASLDVDTSESLEKGDPDSRIGSVEEEKLASLIKESFSVSSVN